MLTSNCLFSILLLVSSCVTLSVDILSVYFNVVFYLLIFTISKCGFSNRCGSLLDPVYISFLCACVFILEFDVDVLPVSFLSASFQCFRASLHIIVVNLVCLLCLLTCLFLMAACPGPLLLLGLLIMLRF